MAYLGLTNQIPISKCPSSIGKYFDHTNILTFKQWNRPIIFHFRFLVSTLNKLWGRSDPGYKRQPLSPTFTFLFLLLTLSVICFLHRILIPFIHSFIQIMWFFTPPVITNLLVPV
ncbi:unnamed protein product [Heterobilharzia americana]|nr:unnamed protein product [Heterobilharzia americana]